MTTYEVRFTLYHYNQGDGGDGNYPHKESFTTIEAANTFYDLLESMLFAKNTKEFASQYCQAGFLDRVDGIYEVTADKKLR